MSGPHVERMTELEQRLTSQRMRRGTAPVLERLRRDFAHYDTVYDGSAPTLVESRLEGMTATLEGQNNLLRRNLSLMEAQLANALSMLEALIQENNELRTIIQHKNEDLLKVVRTIACNSAEHSSQYQEKIRLLQQENAILIRHVQDVLKREALNQEQALQADQDARNLQRRVEESKAVLAQSVGREHQMARKMALLEQVHYQLTEKVYELENIKQELTVENNTMKNTTALLEERIKQANRNDKAEEVQKINHQNKEFRMERVQLLRECEGLKIEKENIKEQMDTYEKEIRKLANNLDLTASLLNQAKSRNAEMQSKIGELELINKERSHQNNALRIELDTSNSYAINRERTLQMEIEELRNLIGKQAAEYEGRYKEMRERARVLEPALQGV